MGGQQICRVHVGAPCALGFWLGASPLTASIRAGRTGDGAMHYPITFNGYDLNALTNDLRAIVEAPGLPVDAFSESDRVWFCENPSRMVRLRSFRARTFDGVRSQYFPEDDPVHWVLVFRFAAGIRLRLPLAIGVRLHWSEPKTDDEVGLILANHAAWGSGPLVTCLWGAR